MGLAWWPSGQQSTLLLWVAQVQSLVQELRSHMLHNAAKNTTPPLKKTNKTPKESFYTGVFSAVSLSSVLAQPCPLLEDKTSQLASTEPPRGVWGHS